MALDVEKNIGEADQKIRYAVGGFIVLMGIIWGSWIVLLGVIVIATAWFQWCPHYELLGINTKKLKIGESFSLDAISSRSLSADGWKGFLNSTNLGHDDRVWRYGLAGFALLLGYAFSSFFWFLIGFVLFGTAISKRCPAYHVIGYNSLKKGIKTEKSAAEISAEVFEIGATEKVDVNPIEAKEADASAPVKAKKAATKPKKTPTKPKVANKKAETKPKPKKKAAKQKAKNLTEIEGIGPKIAEILEKNDVTDFAVLASADHLKLKEMLLAEGNRYAMHDPESWPEQAAMARDGKWDDLKSWQDKYKAGRKK